MSASLPARPTSMIFIDGTNLDRACRDKFFRNDIDFSKLLLELSAGTSLLHTFYATAPYKRDLNPQWYAEQIGTINWLRRMPNVSVSLHQHRMRTSTCTKCGYRITTPKEKGTDVAIASLFTESAVNRAARDLILLSNDSDFGPIFPLARKYGCNPVLAFVLGPGENDFNARVSLTPLTNDAQRLIRINDALIARCWINP